MLEVNLSSYPNKSATGVPAWMPVIEPCDDAADVSRKLLPTALARRRPIAGVPKNIIAHFVEGKIPCWCFARDVTSIQAAALPVHFGDDHIFHFANSHSKHHLSL